MLSLFRRNLFVNYLWLLLFSVACLAYFGLKPNALDILEFQLPLSESHGLKIPLNDQPYFQLVYSFILIYVQALLVANIVIKNRMSRLLSIVPASLFVLYCFILLHSGVVHTILLANLFLIFSLQSLLRLYKKYKPITTIFNSGFFMGIASLIYLPYVIFILGLIIGLMSLRGLKVKELLQLLVAFLCPFFLFGVLLNYIGDLSEMLSHYALSIHIPDLNLDDIQLLSKLILVLLISVLMFFQNARLLKKKKFDVIKKIELNFWFLLFGFLSIFFVEEISHTHMLIISAPFAVLAGLFMESKENATTKEFVFILFVAYYFSLVFDVI